MSHNDIKHRPQSGAVDVAIVGGGPAGAAAAIRLATLGLRVSVLERSHEPTFKFGECLAPTANPILRQLGVDSLLAADGHLSCFGNRSAWGSAQPVDQDFLFDTRGHGWRLDRARFESLLANRAVEAGARWSTGAGVRVIQRADDLWRLSGDTTEGDTFTTDARFLIDASGRSARVASALGVKRRRYDRLVAATAILQTPTADTAGIDSFALVESVPEGWWYSGLLPWGQLALSFMTDSDLLRARTIDVRSATHTWARLRGVGVGGADRSTMMTPFHFKKVWPAHTSQSETVAGARWLAVGDAAVTHDPLSSYGISFAMGSGLHGADAIYQSAGGNADAIPAYAEMILQSFCRFHLAQQMHYQNEARWPEQPFWRRRHQRAGAFTLGSPNQVQVNI
jgi:flavin-dependent dehydrogenase